MPKKPKTLEERPRATHAYVGRAKCGCVRQIIVDQPDSPNFVAGEVARGIRAGFAMQHVTIEESRRVAIETTWDCPHEAPPTEQSPLFQGAP